MREDGLEAAPPHLNSKRDRRDGWLARLISAPHRDAHEDELRALRIDVNEHEPAPSIAVAFSGY